MTHRLRAHPLWAVLGATGIPLGGFVLGAGVVAVLMAPAPPRLPGSVPLDPAAISAKAAVVYDPAAHAVLWQKNADAQLPLASLTKLMTAEVVLSAEPDLGRPVRITQEALRPEGDWGLKPGETRSLGELLTMALVASSNDAIAAAAGSLGDDYVARMNTEAARLGLTRTRFLNPTGLDITNTVAGAYGSAYDVARLAAAFYTDHPDLFAGTLRGTVVVEENGKAHSYDATAGPLFAVPGLIAAKTGYTDLAGGNLVAVFDLDVGHPLVAAVLGSSHEGRFADIKTLVEAARRAGAGR